MTQGANQCIKCGQALQAGAKFCGVCGQPVQAKFCEQCGAKLAPGIKFCESCGSSTGGQAARPATPPAIAPAAAPAQAWQTASPGPVATQQATPAKRRRPWRTFLWILLSLVLLVLAAGVVAYLTGWLRITF